jgi:hypothetical protein
MIWIDAHSANAVATRQTLTRLPRVLAHGDFHEEVRARTGLTLGPLQHRGPVIPGPQAEQLVRQPLRERARHALRALAGHCHQRRLRLHQTPHQPRGHHPALGAQRGRHQEETEGRLAAREQSVHLLAAHAQVGPLAPRLLLAREHQRRALRGEQALHLDLEHEGDSSTSGPILLSRKVGRLPTLIVFCERY